MPYTASRYQNLPPTRSLACIIICIWAKWWSLGLLCLERIKMTMIHKDLDYNIGYSLCLLVSETAGRCA